MQPDPAAASADILRAERDRLEGECDALVQKLEGLKGLEREYRARLDGYLEGLLETLRREGRL